MKAIATKSDAANTKERVIKERKSKKHKKIEMSYEWRHIDHFFEWLEVPAASEHFWKILKLALANGEEETEAKERSNMIFFFEYTKELYENSYILLEREKEKYQTNKE